jgi:hypothetical protein
LDCHQHEIVVSIQSFATKGAWAAQEVASSWSSQRVVSNAPQRPQPERFRGQVARRHSACELRYRSRLGHASHMLCSVFGFVLVGLVLDESCQCGDALLHGYCNVSCARIGVPLQLVLHVQFDFTVRSEKSAASDRSDPGQIECATNGT